jgi:hypothetical protein
MIVNELHQKVPMRLMPDRREHNAEEACAPPGPRTPSTSCGQRLVEIGDQVVLVFDADRQTHHVGACP